MSDTQDQGRFVWRDLMTTDVEGSKAFFTKLFGWTTEERDMGANGIYTMLKAAGGTAFGGMAGLDSSQGVPSQWISYISTGDVDDFCARASDMGATVPTEPMDIPEVGRFAVLSDPQGAWFSVFRDAMGMEAPEPQGMQPHGSVIWNELTTADVDAAKAFYGRMFGWTMQDADTSTIPYTLFGFNGTNIGGIMKKPDEMPVSVWTIYFAVADIDEAVKQVEELGGQILFPVMEVPRTGRLTWATDPAGATFAIMQPDPME